MKGFRLFCLVLGAVLIAIAISATCSGQTTDGLSLGNPFAERTDSYRLRGINLIPKALPVIRIKSPTMADMMGYYKAVAENTPAVQSYAARAQANDSRGADCRARIPYQDAPVDADSILTRCNAGFANLIVGGLRILSEINNSPPR